MKHILFLPVLLAFAFFVFCLSFAGCASSQLQSSGLGARAITKSTSDIDLLNKHIAEISKKNTFPIIVEPLRKSMHNPDRFEFIKAEYALQERKHKRPSVTHITYYYLIRIHFRGENAFGALRLSHQDFALYPDGNIRALPKKQR